MAASPSRELNVVLALPAADLNRGDESALENHRLRGETAGLRTELALAYGEQRRASRLIAPDRRRQTRRCGTRRGNDVLDPPGELIDHLRERCHVIGQPARRLLGHNDSLRRGRPAAACGAQPQPEGLRQSGGRRAAGQRRLRDRGQIGPSRILEPAVTFDGCRTLVGTVDPQARFEAVYAAHNAAVRTYVRRRVDSQDADDVVADVFVIAWRRLRDVPEDPLPWLLGVARRVMANRWRGANRQAALRDRMMSERSRLAPPFSMTPQSRDVLRALSAMREKDRETLLLVAWEGLAPAQAAKVLGVSPNTFSARLSRARRRFERALAAEPTQPGAEHASMKPEVLP
ncbi:MAG: RNA polymerase sigma factor [Solirubrobacteraceae bacterium]